MSVPTKAQMHRAVAAWNARAGIGDRVRFWPGLNHGPGRVGVTSSAAYILEGHTAGVCISSAGFVALSHVELLSDEESVP